jgi:transcriptional regulator with XRE-family HTH domain
MSCELIGRQNGAAIRAFRKKERLTVAELAGFVGLHPQALVNIENNSRPASPKAIRNLARVLGVPGEAITRAGVPLDDEDAPDEAMAAAS